MNLRILLRKIKILQWFLSVIIRILLGLIMIIKIRIWLKPFWLKATVFRFEVLFSGT